jgi:hypothetical protein
MCVDHRFRPARWRAGTAFVRMVLASATLVLASCGGGADGPQVPGGGPQPSSTAPGVLSFTGVPRTVPTPVGDAAINAAFTEAVELAYNAGARGMQTNFSWGALEPSSAGFNAQRMQELRNALDQGRARGLVHYVGIQVINTLYRDGPSDLAALPFDDERVRARLRTLLDAVVGANRGAIRYLSLGNEVDVYLGSRPAEVPAYAALLRDAAQHARALDPSIQVGVTFTADGARGAHQALLRTLNDGITDVVILTYYPLSLQANGTFVVRSPTTVGPDITSMLALAVDKPLVIQEAGYPSAAGTGSSEALQSDFVRALAAAWLASDRRIPYLNIFALHDFSPTTCDELVGFYQLGGNNSFRDYLCSLGLRRADGTPKAAWQVLSDEISAISGPP